jgi:hypothetical protein
MQKELGGVNAQKERDLTAAKVVNTLENRLHKILVKNGVSENRLAQLRQDIDRKRQFKSQDKLLLVCLP